MRASPEETPIFTGAKFVADADYIRIQGMHMTGTTKMQAVCWEGMHEHIECLDNVFTGDTPAIDFIGN
ncbi:MAG: hypothetical protein A2Z14_08340 [Chloroflexi bacterium RBG_16_48_8]|nr:MAG: hypothetical protein A2Z14_08340 [Chloroflexi bacterium RBG_16_48_8]